MKKYPAFEPSFSENAKNVLIDCIKSKSISGNYGLALSSLEERYSSLHNNYFSVTCSSGTAALHLACLGLGMMDKHTVVVPTITNMATFFAPMYTGAKVIACDVDPNDGLIDISALESICKKIKVDFVFIVHLYGHVVNPLRINSLSAKYKFKVIEDCAEAHFAKPDNYHNYVGSNHDASCFSFYANKIISGGEGGITLFKSEKCSELAKNFKNLSFGDPNNSPSKFYHHQIGYNYRLPNTVAALIFDSLINKDLIIKKRELIAHWYDEAFNGKEFIDYLHSKLPSYRVNWVYCIKIKDKYLKKYKSKKEFLLELSLKGVEARDFFYPADKQPFFKNYCKKNSYSCAPTKQSVSFYKNSIYLPVYLDLTKDNILQIVEIIENLLSY